MRDALNGHVEIEDDQTFDVNLGEHMFGGSLDNFTIVVKDEKYDIPVNPDIFPLHFDGDVYNAHLRYTTDDVELTLIKNGDYRNLPNDGFISMDIDGLDEAHGDLAVLYLLSDLRKV